MALALKADHWLVVFPDYPAPVVRNTDTGRELTMMRWGMPPPRTGGPPVTDIRNTSSPHWRAWLKPENRCLVPFNSLAEYAPEPNPQTKKRTWCGSRSTMTGPLFAFTLRHAIARLAMKQVEAAAHCVTEAAENGGPMVFARIGRRSVGMGIKPTDDGF
jgi:putative SOS response-associated peptidase YedK